MKIFILTLGCPRNLVDSEVLEGLLLKDNFELVEEAVDADLAIINTCGFIEDAKNESVSNILQLVQLKKEKKIKFLFVMGCLAQRYSDELFDEISEIDGIFGTGNLVEIGSAIRNLSQNHPIKHISKNRGFLYDHTYPRRTVQDKPFIYVKIQEGCSNRCSYCVIPDLKGPLKSRSIDSVVTEVCDIVRDKDPREIVLIGQDTTAFGLDRSVNSELPDLLSKISEKVKNAWIRLLYTNPARFSEELMEVIASSEKICNYIDIPIQHSNSRILNSMNRKVSSQQISDLIGKIRSIINPVSIRTSVIVGYPGETDEEFRSLLSFIEKTQFDRLGAFIYSREEGTPAYDIKGQVPEKIKHQRFDEIMKTQQKISYNNNSRLLGKIFTVLIDEEIDNGKYLGRSFMDAPEVDGVIYVYGKNIDPGEFVKVKITGFMEYDLEGEAI